MKQKKSPRLQLAKPEDKKSVVLCGMCRRPSYSARGICNIEAVCTKEPKLNLGCGISPKENYINFDAGLYKGIQGWDKHLETDIVGMIEDIETIFPKDYFSEIMSSHVIEHFFYEDSLKFLRSQSQILKVGGKLIVEGPCILGVYKWYEEGRMDLRGLIDQLYPYHNRLFYGELGHLHQHKSGWTGPLLAEEMAKMGYFVTHIGHGQLHGMGWHDFRVEGIRL